MEGDDLEYIPTLSQDPHQALYSSPVLQASPENEPQREVSDPPDPLRPNKYHGPAHKWRAWTAAERDISRSVDLMRARDLSLHLYNVHCLKARGAGSAVDGKGHIWTPDGNWSAWPMLARDVPRSETGIHRGFTVRDEDDGGVPVQDRARTDLREILLGCITKAARQRFEQRECEGCDGSHKRGTPEQAEHSEAIPSSPSSTSGHGSDSRPHSRTTKRSRSNISLASSHSRSSKRRHRSRNEEATFEPVPLTDDDLAMRIAQPSIEHIISSLEHLLQALHTARQHYFAAKKRPAASHFTKRSKNASQQSSSEESSDSVLDEASTTSTTSPDPNQNRNFRRLGQRTWKDILGLAAILGWDSEALLKTRDRCAVLFGETISMPVLDFESVVKGKARGRGEKPRVGDDGRDISADADPDADMYLNENKDTSADGFTSESEMFGGVHVDGYMQPIKKRRGWRGRDRSVRKGKNREVELDADQGQDVGDDIGSVSDEESDKNDNDE